MKIIKEGKAPCRFDLHPLPLDVALAIGRPLEIDTASQADLELLPDIGPARARAIVTYRNTVGRIEGPEDLEKVKGIGPKTVERLQGLVQYHAPDSSEPR